MGLYTSLGFSVQGPLVGVSGRPRDAPAEGVEIRPWTVADIGECERLCQWVHGITRTDDLHDATRLFAPFAARREGRITAYTYAVHGGILAWGVAEPEADMRAPLLGIAAAVPDPLSLHLPTRQRGLFRSCLEQSLRIRMPLPLVDIV